MEPRNGNPVVRIAVAAIIAIAVVGGGLYWFRQQSSPPEPVPAPTPDPSTDHDEPDPAPGPEETGAATPTSDDRSPPPVPAAPVPAADEPPERSPPETVETLRPETPLEEAAARVRVQIAERMPRPQLEMLAGDRLLERLVATVHSLDRQPVPLRFRPLAHVPDLPRVEEAEEELRLPDETDPRYAAYREVFDAFSAADLARIFERNESALERSWAALGEAPETTFRERVIEILDHLAEYDLPEQRPVLVRPEVLYEFADPELENLSWGRKLLIRIGPEHARAVQRKATELAERLDRGVDTSGSGA